MSYRKVTIDTSNLIILSNGKIDWKKSIGLNLYYKIEGTNFAGIIKLVDVDGKNLLISIDNKPKIKIGKESLRKGNIAKQLGIKAKIFKFNIGDTINNQKIIEQIIIQHSTVSTNGKKVTSNENGYVVECSIDHYKYEILEKSLIRGRGCPICGKNKLIGNEVFIFYDNCGFRAFDILWTRGEYIRNCIGKESTPLAGI